MGTNKRARKGVDETMRHVPAQENSPPTVNIARIHAGVRAAEARVKPVQPTEIKDKRIAREAIEQIRRKPSAAALKRHKEQDEALVRLLKK